MNLLVLGRSILAGVCFVFAPVIVHYLYSCFVPNDPDFAAWMTTITVFLMLVIFSACVSNDIVDETWQGITKLLFLISAMVIVTPLLAISIGLIGEFALGVSRETMGGFGSLGIAIGIGLYFYHLKELKQ